MNTPPQTCSHVNTEPNAAGSEFAAYLTQVLGTHFTTPPIFPITQLSGMDGVVNTADVDGDGSDDLVIMKTAIVNSLLTTKVYVARGTTSGWNTPTLWYSFIASTSSTDNTTAGVVDDFNADGRADLILSRLYYDTTQMQYLTDETIVPSNGTSFSGATVAATGRDELAQYGAFADVDGDGRTDFLRWRASNTQVTQGWYVSYGTGTAFGSESLLWTDSSALCDTSSNVGSSIRVSCGYADVDGDRRSDLLQVRCGPAANFHSQCNIQVALATGSHGAGQGLGTPALWAGPIDFANLYDHSIDFRDVNGDGAADLVAFVPSGTAYDVRVGISGGSAHTFAAPATWLTSVGINYESGQTPGTTWLVTDFNGDGMADAVDARSDTASHQLTLYRHPAATGM